MQTITGLGSCRIVTPIRRGAPRQGFRMNHVRNYGFVHSSAEVVQQARFMRGEWQPDPRIWPLISPKRDLLEMLGREHVVSDVYIVEISSLKDVSLGEARIQLNYLSRAFPSLFADAPLRSRFWAEVRKNDHSSLAAFLLDCQQKGLITPEEAEVLVQIRLTPMSVEDIRKDVEWLLRVLPKVVFVTHVQAKLPDGSDLPEGVQLIDTVRTAVQAAGGLVYDPTDLMLSVGQDHAMEHDSLTHYRDDFADRLFDDLHDRLLAPDDGSADVRVP